MSTIRPIMNSGVRLGVVPDDRPSQDGIEEALENLDLSEELEGSCEFTSEMESDFGNYDEETKRNNDEKRYKRLLKRWEDYFESVNSK